MPRLHSNFFRESSMHILILFGCLKPKGGLFWLIPSFGTFVSALETSWRCPGSYFVHTHSKIGRRCSIWSWTRGANWYPVTGSPPLFKNAKDSLFRREQLPQHFECAWTVSAFKMEKAPAEWFRGLNIRIPRENERGVEKKYQYYALNVRVKSSKCLFSSRVPVPLNEWTPICFTLALDV
jgi:hypothetical protein